MGMSSIPVTLPLLLPNAHEAEDPAMSSPFVRMVGLPQMTIPRDSG